MSLASCAEVGVIANSALEARPFNVGLIGLARAQWPVTIDTDMTRLIARGRSERLVDRDEAMLAMRHLTMTRVAQVEVGTIKTLVADSEYGLRVVNARTSLDRPQEVVPFRSHHR